MANELIALLIAQIKQVFGDVKVYDQTIKQGLITPAFLILIPNNKQERQLGKLAMREMLVNVTYFPEDEDNSETENNNIAERFETNFRYIGNRFHVHSLEAQKSDGALVITFTVKKQVIESHDGTKMESLNYGGVLRG